MELLGLEDIMEGYLSMFKTSQQSL